MSRLCIAILHEDFEDLGSLASVLSERHWETRLVDARRAKPLLPDAGDADLLVILGGPMSVVEASRHPFLLDEIAVAAGRLQRDRPTLGICLGSQIMAAALGARVMRGPQREIGWFPIELERGAEQDPAASRLVTGSSMMLHWHTDTFDLPAGAVSLARSRFCGRQGFRHGKFGYAFQFHFEVLPERIGEWTYGHTVRPGESFSVQSPPEIAQGAIGHGPDLVRRARAFLHAYLDLLDRH